MSNGRRRVFYKDHNRLGDVSQPLSDCGAAGDGRCSGAYGGFDQAPLLDVVVKDGSSIAILRPASELVWVLPVH